MTLMKCNSIEIKMIAEFLFQGCRTMAVFVFGQQIQPSDFFCKTFTRIPVQELCLHLSLLPFVRPNALTIFIKTYVRLDIFVVCIIQMYLLQTER